MNSFNVKLTSYILGLLLFVEAGFLSLSILVSLIYQEHDIFAFLVAIVISVVLGSLMMLYGKKHTKELSKKEGFLIVSSSWLLFSLIGSVPFMVSGSIPGFTNAFFETISGFTGTGASILNNIEELPHGILFWRSITQWIGGMGMVVFTIALLPLLKVTGAVTLYNTEAPGLTKDKMTPNITGTARRLWGMYITLTLVLAGLLLLGPMNLFEAVCHSFTAMGTGGYSTKQASIAAFNSPYTEYMLTLFCFIAGINFSLLYVLYHGKMKKMVKDEELRWYFIFVAGATLITTIALLYFNTYSGVEVAFRNALFQVVTIMTTCGYVTADYVTWGSYFCFFSVLLMLIGGSAGSTSGGIKVVRVVVMIKNALNEFSKQLHPSALVPVKINKQIIPNPYVVKTLAFIFVYLCVISIGVTILCFCGSDMEESIGSVVSCIGGVGPGLGRTGPAGNYDVLEPVAKWTLSFIMLIGRLELFTVLVLFTPNFWRNK